MGTSGAEWKLGSFDSGEPLSPATPVVPRTQTTYGSKEIQAIMLANIVLFVQQEGTVELNETPIDIAVSSDGQWSFVLTAQGNIHILAANGAPLQQLSGAAGFDRIEFTGGNRLILTSSKTNKFKIIVLGQVHELNNAGSPFKGPANAPVEIAVFDDFQ